MKALTESTGGIPTGATFRRIGMMRTLSTEETKRIESDRDETLVPYVKIYGDGGGTQKGEGEFQKPKKTVKVRQVNEFSQTIHDGMSCKNKFQEFLSPSAIVPTVSPPVPEPTLVPPARRSGEKGGPVRQKTRFMTQPHEKCEHVNCCERSRAGGGIDANKIINKNAPVNLAAKDQRERELKRVEEVERTQTSRLRDHVGPRGSIVELPPNTVEDRQGRNPTACYKATLKSKPSVPN